MNFEQEFQKAPVGSLISLYRKHKAYVNPLKLFSLLSGDGGQENCILLESADRVKKYGEKSFGCCEPCLKVTGSGNSFAIKALNKTGERFIDFLKKDFSFCREIKVSKDSISGLLKKPKSMVSEAERLKQVTQADVLRTIAFKLKPLKKPFPVYGGLMGAISYDFIDQFEELPPAKKDLTKDPDYQMFFCDHLFLIDYKNKKSVFVVNALKTGKNDAEEIERCKAVLNCYEAAMKKVLAEKEKPKQVKPKPKEVKLKLTSDTSEKQFIALVKKCKRHIVLGDVFQIVASRTIIAEIKARPFEIYQKLRELNPSPYMFYLNSREGTLLGSSPETFIKVEGGKTRKKVEIRPIAGTKPRGMVNGQLDPELDSRYENELKTDEKELAEHTMLVDLARNDVARVSIPGSRFADKSHYVEKYSHVMHLVSNVSGILKPGLDALHAYLASMNMGTLTGAPKVKAMELLRKFEQTKRGFYGGSIGYLTPSGDFDSAIVIRSMRIKKSRAFVRAGAGIVFDSIAEKEFEETSRKARACLKAIELAEAEL